MTLFDGALSDALEVLIDHRGKTPRKLGGDWVDDGHRVVSALNIKDRRVDLNDHHYVDAAMYRRWMPTPLAAGDVLLTSEAPLGEVAYLASTEQWCVGQRLFVLRSKPGILDGRYLYYLLQTAPVRQQILSRASGSTVLGIRQAELVQVRLQLPSVSQQLNIASTLGALDDKIESNRRLQSLCWKLVDTTYQHLVAGSGKEPLSALVAFEYGKALPGPARVPGLVPVFGSGGRVGSHDMALIDGPAVVVGRKGTVGALHWSSDACWPIDTTYFVRCGAGVPMLAAYMALRHAGLSQMNSDSAVPGLNRTAALTRIVASPRVPGLHAWNTRSELFAARAATAISETTRLAALRDALLPELLSGRIQVPEASQAIESALA